MPSIDVDHYLSRLYTPRKEPNYEAIGGIPLTLINQLENDLKEFKNLNIKPIFVFQGLNTSIKQSYFENPELLPFEKHYRKVWEDKLKTPILNNNSQINNTESFRDGFNTRLIINHLLKFLNSNDIDYIIAPYSNWIQLHYMFLNNIIDTIFGSTDGLLIENGIEKFILSLEFENKQFKYLDKSSILNKLNLNSKQFKDISMVVGNGFQLKTLNILPHIPTLPTFPSLHDFILNGSSIYNTLLSSPNKSLMEDYRKGCSALEFMPVLKLNGRVEPIQLKQDSNSFLSITTVTPTNSSGSSGTATTTSTITAASTASTVSSNTIIPNDLHEFIGQKLPDELFFYQSVGLNLFELCETLSNGVLIERLPLDVSLTTLYNKLLTNDNILDLRGQTLNLLSNSLNRYYQFKKLSMTTFFKIPSSNYELIQKRIPPTYLSLKPILIHHFAARSFEIITLLSGLSSNDEFLLNKTNNNTSEKISTNYELISTSLVRSFILLDLINKDSKRLNNWGKSLKLISISKLNSNNNNNKNPIEILLLILIFFKNLNKSIKLDDLINPNDIKFQNSNLSDLDKNSIILIIKFLSIYPINNLNPINNFNFKISRPLLQFRSVFNKLNKIMYESISCNLVSILMLNSDDANKYQRDNNSWKELVNELPFSNELSSVSLGLISISFFENLIKELNSENLNDLNDLANVKINNLLINLNDSFKILNENINLEFLKGLKFFKEIIELIKFFDSCNDINLDKSIIDTFKNCEYIVEKILHSQKI
ncbi:hypothetical protein B5S30_g2233 [[Candida] boidinii]|nr:hypothetical protein B5S30_g2233 [[Candida] boidinii]